jgi:hypothetical protein
MIDLLSAPTAIEAPAAITDSAWYRNSAASGTGQGGAVFGRNADEPDEAARVSPRLSEPVLRRLRELLRLEAGWDSYGARRVSERAVLTALAFLARRTHPRPSVVPTVRGGIQLEWHNGRVDVEVECLPNGAAQLAAEDSETGEYVERWVMPGHIAVEEWLDRLAATSTRAVQ